MTKTMRTVLLAFALVGLLVTACSSPPVNDPPPEEDPPGGETPLPEDPDGEEEPPEGTPLAQMVAAGQYHSLLLTTDGTVFAWGRNNRGQLGDGTVNLSETPIDITGQFSGRVTSISSGELHSFALTEDGKFYTWGANVFGFAWSEPPMFLTEPVDTSGFLPDDITDVAVGTGHILALTAGGRLFSWGDNEHGQLGDASTSDSDSPVEITGRIPGTVTAIAAGGSHSLAITEDGTLYSWGRNNVGQLGNGENCGACDRLVPQDQSDHLPAAGIAAIAAAYDHSLAVTTDGRTLAWGFNVYGQLGNGSIERSPSPSDISSRMTGPGADVSAATRHTLAVTGTGELYAWGDNRYGKLGTGTTTDSLVPVAIGNRINGQVSAVAAGAGHSLAVTRAGRVYAWGDNTHGQLGDGTRTESHVPVDVSSLLTPR